MVRSRTGPQIHFRITDHSATEDILQGSIRFGRVDDTVIDVHLCLLEHQQPFIKVSPFNQIVSSGTESFFELQAVHIPVCLPGHTDENLCRIDRSPFRNVQCGHHPVPAIFRLIIILFSGILFFPICQFRKQL